MFGTSLKSTGSGTIDLYGIGGGTGSSTLNIGVFLGQTAAIESENGDISVYGRGGAVGAGSYGVAFSSIGTNSLTTAGGDINVEGQGDVAPSDIYIASSNGGIVSNGAGTITLQATNGSIMRALGGTFTVGGALATGDINLIANDLSLQAMSKTSGDIYVKPVASTSNGPRRLGYT